MPTKQLRDLPSVDRLLGAPELQALASEHSQGLVVAAIRQVLAQARSRVQAGGVLPAHPELVQAAVAGVMVQVRPSLGQVINATGVILHTNLGRAPLSRSAAAAIQTVAESYNNLEYDLANGERGSRYAHVSGALQHLTGAEAALVVNNNAAAVLLALTTLASDREVIISRGQLVEVGGGFRIPEVMAASGARLVEVGTTNRTYLEDYERAVGEKTAAFLLVHSSNYRIIGFTHQASVADLSTLAHARGLPVIFDQGSGALLDTAALGLVGEPSVPAAIGDGADLVCFSGDKLLGGPQAGIIVGRADLIEKLLRHPLARALRVDKSTLAALGATLTAYVRGRALDEVPVWRMLTLPLPEIQARARQWQMLLKEAGIESDVLTGESTVGGGALPGASLPTWLLALTVTSPDLLATSLRKGPTPVVVRIESGRLLLDPRTVLPGQDGTLVAMVLQALGRTDAD